MEADAGQIAAVGLDRQLIQPAAVQRQPHPQGLLQQLLLGAKGLGKGAQLHGLPLGRFGLLGAAQQGSQAAQVPVQPVGGHRQVAESLAHLVRFGAVPVLRKVRQIPLAQGDHVQRALAFALECVCRKPLQKILLERIGICMGLSVIRMRQAGALVHRAVVLLPMVRWGPGAATAARPGPRR